jgi:hypothetical protein
MATGEATPVPMMSKFDELQNRLGCCGEEKGFFPTSLCNVTLYPYVTLHKI